MEVVSDLSFLNMKCVTKHLTVKLDNSLFFLCGGGENTQVQEIQVGKLVFMSPYEYDKRTNCYKQGWWNIELLQNKIFLLGYFRQKVW